MGARHGVSHRSSSSRASASSGAPSPRPKRTPRPSRRPPNWLLYKVSDDDIKAVPEDKEVAELDRKAADAAKAFDRCKSIQKVFLEIRRY